MKYFITTCLVSIFTVCSFSQSIEPNPIPHIEVIGKAEKLVEPDEIYLNINLLERVSGKDKITVEAQEAQLKKALTDAKIPLNRLTLASANSNYVNLKWKQNQVVSSKGLILKLVNVPEVDKTLEILDRLKITSAYISRVDHSQIEELKKEVRILAIKAAKDKAEYLLNAIGNSIDKTILVREQEVPNYRPNPVYANYKVEASYGNSQNEVAQAPIGFEKINVESSIEAHFSIK